MKLPQRPEGDEGVTLIELIVVIVIMAVVAGALAAGFLVTTHNTVAVNARLERSHDAQLVANYIVTDAEKTDRRGVSFTDTTTCSPTGSALRPVLRLRWSAPDGSSGTTMHNVNYVLDGSGALTRWTCGGADAPAHNTVGHDVATATAVCTPTACDQNPTGIRIAVTETVDPQDYDSSTAYSYSLNATFRTAYALPVVPSARPADPFKLVLLDNQKGLSLANGAGLALPDNGGIADNGPLSVSGKSSANSTITGTNLTVYGNGKCTGCSSSVLALWHGNGGAVTDPYPALPSPPALAGQASGCGDSATAQPGDYGRTLTVKAKKTCVLEPGIYVLHGGVNVQGTLTSHGGVLLYIVGGAFRANGGGRTGAKVELTPYSAAPYAGFSVVLLPAGRPRPAGKRGPAPKPPAATMDIGNKSSLTGPNGTSAGIIYGPTTHFTSKGGAAVLSKMIIVGDARIDGGRPKKGQAVGSLNLRTATA